MPTIKVEVQLSVEDLLSAVEQLSLQDLERFVPQVLLLQAQRQPCTQVQTEAALLLKINQGIPSDIQKHYSELIAQQRSKTLTLEGQSELQHLTERIEKLEAERLEHLAKLARLRKISLAELMENLGIQLQTYT
ncbi:MAG: STAS/SEC14 domain-containing protein [Actinomycetota bacterium]